jgi:hypothetical protein
LKAKGYRLEARRGRRGRKGERERKRDYR